MAEPVPLVAPPTGIQAASDCFAARVLDRSVDRIYPPGSLVFCRPPPLDGRLPAEHPLIVRFLSVPGRDESLEVLIGHLARTDAGDLLLRTCSTLPELEHFRTIRPAFDSFD